MDLRVAERALRMVQAVCKVTDVALSEEVAKIVKRHALAGGLILILPAFGLDGIIYAIILWRMYKKICDCVGIPFWQNFFKNVLGGFVINLLIVLVLNFVLDFIPVVGWIGIAIIGFIATLLSGCLYLEALARIYNRRNEKMEINFNKALEELSKDEDIQNEVNSFINNL